MTSYAYLFLGTSILLLGLCTFTLYLIITKKNRGKSLISLISDLESQRTSLQRDIASNQLKLNEAQTALETTVQSHKHLLELEQNENNIRALIQQSEIKLGDIQKTISELESKRQDLNANLNEIQSTLALYSPLYDFIKVGFFEEPEYLFEISERYKLEIKAVRDKQKDLITKGEAITIPDTYALIEDTQFAKKIMEGQVRLMLKAFNIECDQLIGSVKPSTYPKTLERIEKLANELEKNTVSLSAGFTKEYLKLKFQECTLYYQFKLKEEREQEEQQRIREQMREEQKATQEFERAVAKAQKEEQLFHDALEVARAELAASADKEKSKLEDKVKQLEQLLLEAQEKEQRAKSMAEQTKRGHVYVISNIGSFGEEVYKIGLTRRLDPLERVKELGDASVPFPFDIHAMIFSEDAPALEAGLHREFNKDRVNQTNYRKEFFNVTLDDIKNKATKLFGKDLDFKMTALAEEYRESRRLRGLNIGQGKTRAAAGAQADIGPGN